MSSAQEQPMLPGLFELIANCPTPRKYLAAGVILPKAEAADVLRSTSKIHLTDVQKEQYILSVAHALSSNDIDDEMEKVAEEAKKNAHDVEVAFTKATVGLIFVDMRCGTNFAIRMKPIVRMYAEILLDSIPLARNVAQYGEDESMNL